MYKLHLSLAGILALASCSASSQLESTHFPDCDGINADVQSRELKVCVAKPPEYPMNALRNGIEGVCHSKLYIEASGLVTDVKVQCTPVGYFEESVIEAKSQFKFLPRIVDGKPVPTIDHPWKDDFKLR